MPRLISRIESLTIEFHRPISPTEARCQMELSLNERAWKLLDTISAEAAELRIDSERLPCGTELFDFGVEADGGLGAGIRLAEVCLANLAHVSLSNSQLGEITWPTICVWTDQPVAACLASQYAGWQIATDNYFGMGSGPMRAAAAHEKLFADIGFTERPERCVGVIESAQLPTDDVCQMIAQKCGIAPENLRLIVAPTSSMAGNVQVVARSIETALHKLHELGWDMTRIHCGMGTAPLPPVAKNDLEGIGRTNDAVLYGGNISLWVSGDDESISELGPQIPSSASPAYGKPFLKIFEEAGRDFYQIDPHLFSPAEVMIHNLDTGKIATFGKREPQILRESFGLDTADDAAGVTL